MWVCGCLGKVLKVRVEFSCLFPWEQHDIRGEGIGVRSEVSMHTHAHSPGSSVSDF